MRDGKRVVFQFPKFARPSQPRHVPPEERRLQHVEEHQDPRAQAHLLDDVHAAPQQEADRPRLGEQPLIAELQLGSAPRRRRGRRAARCRIDAEVELPRVDAPARSRSPPPGRRRAPPRSPAPPHARGRSRGQVVLAVEAAANAPCCAATCAVCGSSPPARRRRTAQSPSARTRPPPPPRGAARRRGRPRAFSSSLMPSSCARRRSVSGRPICLPPTPPSRTQSRRSATPHPRCTPRRRPTAPRSAPAVTTRRGVGPSTTRAPSARRRARAQPGERLGAEVGVKLRQQLVAAVDEDDARERLLRVEARATASRRKSQSSPVSSTPVAPPPTTRNVRIRRRSSSVRLGPSHAPTRRPRLPEAPRVLRY